MFEKKLMIGEELWASILQEAISGRLVPKLNLNLLVEQIGEAPKDVSCEIYSDTPWSLW